MIGFLLSFIDSEFSLRTRIQMACRQCVSFIRAKNTSTVTAPPKQSYIQRIFSNHCEMAVAAIAAIFIVYYFSRFLFRHLSLFVGEFSTEVYHVIIIIFHIIMLTALYLVFQLEFTRFFGSVKFQSIRTFHCVRRRHMTNIKLLYNCSNPRSFCFCSPPL